MSPVPAPQLTTHVLDLAGGRPAEGLGFVLSRFDGSAAAVLVRAKTNSDGRTDRPLLAGADLTPGRYELAFEVDEYYAGRAATGTFDPEAQAPSIPFLDIVPIRFGVAPGTGHLHVALLVTPWSYTTYRGS